MIVTVHQAEHIGWSGYYNKMMNADIFIYLDDCNFRKNYFQNRNRILTTRGLEYITVPVESKDLTHTRICDVKISGIEWKTKYLGKIYEAYRKCEYFDHIYGVVEDIISTNELSIESGEWDHICELNIYIINTIRSLLGIDNITYESSCLDVNTTSSRRIADLVRKVGGNIEKPIYLSGPSGRDYLDMNDFDGIEVIYHEFNHPIYKQHLPGFTPQCCVLDLLMNYNCYDAREIIMGGYSIRR